MVAKVFYFFMLFCVSAFAHATTPSQQLSQYLSGYQTYQAQFTQTTFTGNGASQKSSGRVMMMRPGKFRWETNTPTKQIIIANGKTLWVYDVDLQQATRQKVSAQGPTNPAALLTGDTEKVMSRYHVTTIKREGVLWYQLTPKLKNSNFTWVQMRFQKNRLVAMWVKNNLGQTSYFNFKGVKLNVPLNSNLFIFIPPPGVSVLK